MIRTTLAFTAVNLAIFLAMVARHDFLELFAPRGGILSFALFHVLILALAWLGRDEGRPMKERAEFALGAWVLLWVTPVAAVVTELTA